ncbi:hypothetical protein CYJ25_07475 [Schaalia turicensis]|uniref:Lsr2 family protein n=1 Tax=Schaalia turicensis TaxID=131111 RepID=A0A2I1I3X4_9ACTO|nr:Lsr2 family protein [Schaalia turicensis]PKY65835.1 hypothetical protein CYJ25_07475 [Schaalia turicensis]
MKKTHVVLVDDIDGTPAKDTVTFSFQGVTYEIDLSEEHISEMSADFEKWISSSRRISGRAIRGSRVASSTALSRAGEIRAWATKNGIHVSDRGRIPADIVAKFEKAHA